MVRELLPQFLEEGRLCWLRAPLYKIDYKGKETMFAFNDEELNTILKKNGKGDIKRFKGLGEMEPEDTSPSMFGKYQRLEKFVVNNNEETYEQLQNLMGEDVEFRRDFIFKNIDFSKLEE